MLPSKNHRQNHGYPSHTESSASHAPLLATENDPVSTSSVEDDDWISLLPPRSKNSFSFLSDPSFLAFANGESSVCHFPNALMMRDADDDNRDHDNNNNSKSSNNNFLTLAIQEDARMLKALGFGASAGVVNNPAGERAIRQGVSQLWLQVPTDHTESSSPSSSSLAPFRLTGNIDGRTHLYRVVESLRYALEQPPFLCNGIQGRSRSLPPDQVELSYLWYDGTAQAYYGRHIDTPQVDVTSTTTSKTSSGEVQDHRRRRIRCISFLLYLGGVTDEPWYVEEHGGQLRILLDQVDRIPLGARDDSKEENVTTEHYMDIVPELGTLVLFDSATVPHEVLPTKRDRLAVVGWFGTIV
jgi:hypothetical protein